jgi:cytochrome c-type biogenesis protein CcmH/NrfG
MRIHLFFLIVFCSPSLVMARDKPETWIEVRSPHFCVISNSNEKQARRVADQFERMRAVFHTILPKIQIDTLGSITVLATKDEKSFRALEPGEYLAKGQIRLGGLFLPAPDKNYVLLRLDAEGEHPYAAVYHEYTHLLMSKAEWIPLWLNEGLAEFYQNTEIRDKEVALGQPSPENLGLLRESRLLPLTTLFTVDHASPYYHEENKGSIFYAESWALTHYLQVKDYRDQTHRLTDYVQLLAQKVDAITAATRTFGDLEQLQSALENYIRQASFKFFKTTVTTDLDTSAFEVRAMNPAQADAVRADFLANDRRTADARALLANVLQEEPQNVLAHETMGRLEFQEHHLDQALRWYSQAVQMDSQSFLAHYYFAAISMTSSMETAEEAKIESSLRTSIKLNPNFAPSYDLLASFLARQRRNLEEARLMELHAVQLEPANLNYRLNAANVLLQMQRGKDAVSVIRNALPLASSPQETELAQGFLLRAEEYAQQQERNLRSVELGKTAGASGAATSLVKGSTIPEESEAPEAVPPSGPRQSLTGVLKDVRCDTPAIDMNLITQGKAVALHSRNYFKIDYSSLGVALAKDLNPCKDLEGRKAKVEFVDSASGAPVALVAIEIHK